MKARPWREVQEEARSTRLHPPRPQLLWQQDDGTSFRMETWAFHRVPVGPALWDGAWRPL